MKKGYTEEEGQGAGLTLIFQQSHKHLQHWETNDCTSLIFVLHTNYTSKGQSRKYFFSNGKLRDICERGQRSAVTSFFSNTDILGGCVKAEMKTGKNLNKNEQLFCSI